MAVPKISAVLIIKIVLTLIPVFFVGLILNDNFLLLSRTTFRIGGSAMSSGIIQIDMDHLVRSANKDFSWRITSDILPIKIHIPRSIAAITVKGTVRSDGSQSDILFTAIGSKEKGNMTNRISSGLLNNLDWNRIEDRGLTLWQRSKHYSQRLIELPGSTAKKPLTKIETDEWDVRQYKSINEFFQQPPNAAQVASLGLDAYALVRIDNYRPAAEPLSIRHTLRGSHDFYVYAANEDLHLQFDKIDLNWKTDPSVLAAYVAPVRAMRESAQPWMKTVRVADDGIFGGGEIGQPQPVDIRIPNVPPGLYLIRIVTSEDVLIKNIVSDQHFFATNRLFLADGPAYFSNAPFTPVDLQTNGSQVTLSSSHDLGSQAVKIGDVTYQLAPEKKTVTASNLPGTTQFNLKKGDAVVESDGFISFDQFELPPNQHLNPVTVTQYPNLGSYDYFLADYVPPTGKNSYSFQRTYALSELQLSGIDGKTLSFQLQAPALKESDAVLSIDSLSVTLTRGPLPWQKAWSKVLQFLKS